MASNVELNAGSGGSSLLTKEVTHDGDTAHLQGVHILGVTGSEGSYTATNISDPTNGLLVNLGSNNDVTVSGTVTAELGATDNGVLDAIAASLAGTLTVGSHAVTNAGTFVVQENGAALTALQIIDDWDETDRAKVNLIVGQAGIAAGAGAVGVTVPRVTLASDDPGVALLTTIDSDTSTLAGAVSGSEMQADVVTLPTTVHSANYDTGAGTDTTLAFGIAVPASGGAAVVPGDATGGLKVNLGADNDVTVTGTVAVTQSGTWDEVGINDSGNSITVDAPVATPVFVRLSDGSSAISTLPVSIASVPSHAVTNAGTFPVQVDGSALTALQLIDNIVLAEDAIHQTGDPGVMALAVRQSSQADFGADGDYVPLSIDDDGGLRVSIVAGAGSGGTAAADDADFTAGTTSGTPAMGVYESTPTSVTDGDLGTVGITSTRQLRTSAAQSGTWTVDLGATDNAVLDNIDGDLTTIIGHVDGLEGLLTTIDGDTGSILTAVQLIDDAIFAEDVGAQAADKGIAILAVRRDTPSALATTDNDYINLTTDSSGRLWTHDDVLDAALSGSELQVDIVGSLPAGTAAIGKLAANSGVDIGDVDVTSISAGTNLIGQVYSRPTTGAIYNGTTSTTPAFVAIDAASSGDNTLLAAQGASNKIRVYALYLVSAGTVNVRFESGASGTALSGQMNLVANTGFVLPYNPLGWFETAANTLLNLELSGAVSVDGGFVYSVVT